ncbi:XRE family transcriptional regulator [bacterium]|nr:MAG: XRE family transcriptional regulator [bacterium]
MGSHANRRPKASPKSDPDYAQRRQKARREAREAKGLSLEDLGKILDRSPALVERMERQGNVPQHLAVIWSKTLGCKIELLQ